MSATNQDVQYATWDVAKYEPYLRITVEESR